MVQLQPRLPRRRKKKNEGVRDTFQPSEAPADRRDEPGKEGRRGAGNRNMIIGIVAVAVIVVVLVVIVMTYSAPPQEVKEVTGSQIMPEIQRLRELSTYPANKNINPADYPKVFGTWRNYTLVEQYYCSDVCPDYGRVDLVFQGITNEQCEQVGGRSLHDLAWGGYIGCEPRAYS